MCFISVGLETNDVSLVEKSSVFLEIITMRLPFPVISKHSKLDYDVGENVYLGSTEMIVLNVGKYSGKLLRHATNNGRIAIYHPSSGHTRLTHEYSFFHERSKRLE